MKKLTITLLGIFAFSTVFAFSNPEEKEKKKTEKASLLDISYTSSNSVKLTFLDEKKGTIKLTVINKDSNKLLHSQRLTYQGPFAVPVDLSSQPEGLYTLEVEGKDFQYQQDVFVSHLSREDVHASVTMTSEEKVAVKVLRQNVPVTITIQDAQGNKIFSRTYNGSKNFVQEFDLQSMVGKGQLFVNITGEKSSIFKTL